MNALQDRRVIAALGGVVVLLLAILIGAFALHSRKPKGEAIPTTAANGLQIDQAQADNHANAGKPVRCFVNGQFVGMQTVADCAQKNGVASQALDVGLDPATGAVTNPSGSLAPPPAPAVAPQAPAQEAEAETPAPAPATPSGVCLRYTGDGWRAAGSGVSAGQCARILYEGRCARAGEAIYGRWNDQTLRLITGQVQMSGDNRNFHALMPQGQDCSLPSG
jgi:hypothetical protein